jgi:hypothetical protein
MLGVWAPGRALHLLLNDQFGRTLGLLVVGDPGEVVDAAEVWLGANWG